MVFVCNAHHINNKRTIFHVKYTYNSHSIHQKKKPINVITPLWDYGKTKTFNMNSINHQNNHNVK